MMNISLPGALRFDLTGLAQAISNSHASDALQCKFAQPQLDVLAAYLQPEEFRSGQVLMAQGSEDRTLYFVESGTLAVHYEDEKARVRMAMVGPGTVLGEGAFFAHQARSATVQASSGCKLWSLSMQRFSELAHRHPAIALELTLAMGGVMAKRLYSRPKRVAVT
jgi:CRP/FNR family transcriptional regulator, cyclic AMP receptor protein